MKNIPLLSFCFLWMQINVYLKAGGKVMDPLLGKKQTFSLRTIWTENKIMSETLQKNDRPPAYWHNVGLHIFFNTSNKSFLTQSPILNRKKS